MATDTNEQDRYALSFTSGGLLSREAEAIATIYLECQDWQKTREWAISKNVLQARTNSTSVRLVRETIQRLSALTNDEISLLAEGSLGERWHLMWAAVCRRYQLIGEFAEEVLREHFLLLQPTVSVDDFERFITGKSLWHPELDDVKPSTREKLRQAIFRMLHEAGLLSKTGEIIPAVLSERVRDVFASRSPNDIRFFPTSFPTEVNA